MPHKHKTQAVSGIDPYRCVAGEPSEHNERAHGGKSYVRVCSCGLVQLQNRRRIWSEKGPWHDRAEDKGWPWGVPWMDWKWATTDHDSADDSGAGSEVRSREPRA